MFLAGLLFCGGTAQASVRPERWRWSGPAPHGNNVMDMLVTSTVGIQVGDAGTVYFERGDGRWAPVYTGVTNYLRAVAQLEDRIILCGEKGCILWSDDGLTFSPAQVSPATGNWFEAVATSLQQAVAVGDNGAIYASTNGSYWSKVTSGTTEWLRGVASGSGAFVAVGENGTILRRAYNGTSWSKMTSGTTVHLNRVRALGSGGSAQFCAVGNKGVLLVSGTGQTWTPLQTGITNNLYDIAYSQDGLLAVGDQVILWRPAGAANWTSQVTSSTNSPPAWTYLSAVSSAGQWLVAGRTGMMIEGSQTNGPTEIQWRMFSDASRAWLWDVTSQRGIYVAVGDLATILTSLDGLSWAREVVPAEGTNTVLLGVGGTTNTLFSVGSGGTVLASRSGLATVTLTNDYGTNIVVTNATFNTLGLVWTNVPAFTTNSLQGVAALENTFVISGDRGALFVSSDSTNWVDRSVETSSFLSGIAAGPAGWIAVGSRGAVYRSATADSWTQVDTTTTNWLYRARYVGGYYFIVGQNGSIYTSQDTLKWTRRNSGTTEWLSDVTFLEGTWYVVGNQGTVLSSTDLAQWSSLAIPSAKSLHACANSGGQLITAGVEGVILRNQVVPILEPVNFLAYSRSTVEATSATNTTASVYEVFLMGGKPDQHFQFQSCTNLQSPVWTTNAVLDLFDASGTVYLLRTRDLTNAPAVEFYRNVLLP